MPPEDHRPTPGDGGSAFVSRVGQRYLELRGSGLLLPSLDAERIRRWEERGVPLGVALDALERAHAAWRASGRAARRRPFPLELAEREIERTLQGRMRGGIPTRESSTEACAPDYAGLADSLPKLSPEVDPVRPLAEDQAPRALAHALDEVLARVPRRAEPPAIAPAPASHVCAVCNGKGYRLGVEGPFARAWLCNCERHCPECEGRGFLVRVRDGYEFTVPCTCQSLARRVAAYNAAQLPARFWNKTFENFYVEKGDPPAIREARDAFRSFALGRAPSRLGLGLIGGPGRGKTHLLAATLATLTLERGIRCRYVEISLLFADLKAAISDPRARATVDKIDELAQVDVLAIDELGKGRGSVFEEEVLDELIGRRYNNEKPTLFATNHPLEERPGEPLGESLLSRVGPRIFSRLHEMVVFLELPPKANDHRLLLRKMMR